MGLGAAPPLMRGVGGGEVCGGELAAQPTQGGKEWAKLAEPRARQRGASWKTGTPLV